VFHPALAEMRNRGVEYRGVLYAGMILTPDGPRVLEFNCRFGDPETQVLLPLLESDLAELLLAAATGTLDQVARPEWDRGVRVGVVLASGGYPDGYRTGFQINGLDELDPEILAFHAGTNVDDDGSLVTSGGRVLTLVGSSTTFTGAREHVYRAAKSVTFTGAQYRSDIAYRETAVEV
jgi:phosphoribosylamine---glycine ligase